ncbi:heterokaryon incompatibility protein-domain-containing protein [Paraphoma chrysanthemicola]|uniref:Heterokaryon incompatibility protein-domain-containing protein n=1 Tax=Paraphoma chrysanthemicola TaxID=798071 RepID=A0A8K0QUS7_9PLEO|nr:heterokaryon incompatibility protein-domain-containing protein [Paraphoma chrysanthemicola]
MVDVGPSRSSTSVDIASTTIACRQSLERCVSIRSLKIHGWAENRLADFKVWDSGLGASSSRRASLEDRLAPKPHVRTAVLNLLIIYQNAIEVVVDLGLLHDERDGFKRNGERPQAKNPHSGIPTSRSHDADEELTVDDSTLPEALEIADLVLNDLARLAALIRRAGTTSRLLRADATFDPRMNKHGELRNHLYQILQCQPTILEDRRHVHWDSIDPSLANVLTGRRDDYWHRVDQETVDFSFFSHVNSEIQERLVVANLRRSHRFTYSRRHGSKLENSSHHFKPAINLHGQGQPGVGFASPMPHGIMSSGPEPGTVDGLGRTYSDQTGKPESGTENMTDTVASEVETVVMKDIAEPTTPTQQAVTEISTTGSRLRYPKPPRCEPGLTLFTCPCCCVPLPITFADPRRWRKHLKEDILPYTCVLPKCPKPATLFAEKSAWLDHMSNDHVASISWVCDMCGDTETYTTESGFIGHLTHVHKGAIAADQVALVTEMCYKRTVEKISSCPLCSWAEDADGYVTNEQLLEHVAEHIHSFALRSLPWAPDKDDLDRKTFEQAFKKVEDWFAKYNPEVEGSGYKSTLPSAEPRKIPDPYFLTHEYFAESSCASSLDLVLSDDGNLSDSSDESTDTHVDRATSKLCGFCRWMLSNWQEHQASGGYDVAHHDSPDELRRSASELGCALCYQFCKGFTGELSTSPTGFRGQIFVIYVNERMTQTSPMERDMILRLTFVAKPRNEARKDLGYSDVKMLHAKHTRSLPFKTNTKDSLDLAAKWLHECMTSHPKCKQRASSRRLPTRLLAINETRVRLCTTQDISKELQYATLSYCWGATPFISLSNSNWDQMRHGIPLENLPRTLRDAVEIARSLGIFYLWVDSLCIIQGSAGDWTLESSRMADVYGGSSLNIAATSARGTSEGCFFNRPERFVCQADVSTKDGTSSYDFVPDDYISVTVSGEPLLSRAWMLQERLLPSRTLHFTKTELYWECNHFSASETFPDGIPSALKKPDTYEKKPLDPSMWSWIVGEYSKGQLTKIQDKPVAIAAIAQEIQSKNHDRYVAGMWHNDLAIQLCWFVYSIAQDHASPNYIAPTWSWLSTTGQVSYPRSDPSYRSGDEVIHISILDVNIETLGNNKFGGLKTGSLLLACNVLQDVVLERDELIFAHNQTRFECSIYLDEPPQILQGVFVLPILSRQDGSLVQGLLLEPVGGEVNTYKRLGLFKSYGEDAVHKFEDAASKSLSQEHERVEIKVI